MSVVCPARMCGQPCSWGSVGVPNRETNHSRTRGWAQAREEGRDDIGAIVNGFRSFVNCSPLTDRRIKAFATRTQFPRALAPAALRASTSNPSSRDHLGPLPITVLESPFMSKLRARKIKLILFDVDGVFTDGKIWIFPAPGGVSQSGTTGNTLLERSARQGGQSGSGFQSTAFIEAKGFHAHDGAGISLARLAGIKTGLITKRISETVALRARDLQMDHVHQGIQKKAAVLGQILEKENITATEVAFVGDDVIDLPIMRKCGLAIAVKNARPEVKAEAHYITAHAGGDGAARDAIEYILKAQGKWKKAVADYTEERGG